MAVLSQTPRVSSWVRTLARSRIGVQFSRYTGASLVAVVVSTLVYAFAYGPLGTSSGVALVAGFVSGLLPKYVLCRNWAWKRRGRWKLGPEALAYVAVSVAGFVFAYYLTEFAEGYARSVADGALQVFLMTMAFLVSQGLFFILKFVAFDQMVFRTRERPQGRGSPGRGPDRGPGPGQGEQGQPVGL